MKPTTCLIAAALIMGGWTLKEIKERNLDIFNLCYPDAAYRREVLQFAAKSDGEWRDFKPIIKGGRVIDTSWAIVHLSDGTAIGIGVTLVLGSSVLGGVIAMAMMTNIVVAGLAGVLVPLGLEKAGADPAVASSVFVTMVTDSMGFLVFLGLAAAAGL